VQKGLAWLGDVINKDSTYSFGIFGGGGGHSKAALAKH